MKTGQALLCTVIGLLLCQYCVLLTSIFLSLIEKEVQRYDISQLQENITGSTFQGNVVWSFSSFVKIIVKLAVNLH